MVRTAPLPKPKANTKTLAQQQNDFTSEGSPPPGRVAGTEPVAPKPAPGPVKPAGR